MEQCVAESTGLILLAFSRKHCYYGGSGGWVSHARTPRQSNTEQRVFIPCHQGCCFGDMSREMKKAFKIWQSVRGLECEEPGVRVPAWTVSPGTYTQGVYTNVGVGSLIYSV